MPITIQRKPYRHWPQAVHLSNGVVDLVVVPTGGRVVRYGRVGGPNLLWENPLDGPDKTGWHNHGGDKVWVWPEATWRNAEGNHWPPLGEMDQADFDLRVTDDGVVVTGPLMPTYGVRTVREIALDDDCDDDDGSTVVQVVNRLEPVDGADVIGVPVAAWTVTQIPAAKQVTALVTPGSGVRHLSPAPFAREEIAGPACVLERHPARTSKAGLDGTSFRVEQNGSVLTQRLVGASDGDWVTGERAQVFSESDQTNRTTYVELEFTSPKMVPSSDGPWVAVRWEIL
jgi:hypothetical protein